MTKGPETLLNVPLAEYFKGRVQKALLNQQIQTSDLLEFYLVNLLEDFRKTEKVFEKEGEALMEKPLALLLAKAVDGDLNTKIRTLKRLGDLSLYTAGFFKESLRRKPVGIHYYVRMGGGAYGSLAAILSPQKTFAELYGELAQLFPNLVNVLSEVAGTAEWKTNRDLLKLYEQWLATGDAHLESLLTQEGIPLTEIKIYPKT